MSPAPRLALHAIEKRYGDLVALASLTLELPPAHVHGILGENGAGKSTLVRVVAGAVAPDGGTVFVDGTALAPGAPRAARAAGVGAVYQHFALIGALSIAENLALGRPEAARALVSPRRLAAEAEELAARYEIPIGDPTRPCGLLPVGTQARVEILRALSAEPRVLVLDEPTAVLTPPEIGELFATVRRLKAAGLLVLFITHKLDEALALCDRVSIMRAGRLVATVAAGDLAATELARLMVGAPDAAGEEVETPGGRRAVVRAPGDALRRRAVRPQGAARVAATPALGVVDLTTARSRSAVALHRISLAIDAGEICGIAGVDGNGQDELAGALYGLRDRRGVVTVAGEPVAAADVRAAQHAGMALVPPDRRRDALAPALALWENALLAAPLLARFAPRGLLAVAEARRFAASLARDYRIVLTSIEQPAGTLSGGNQQRLVLARTLALRPRVLVAVNPTRGLDIAATAHVHDALRGVADDGTAVLLISTELDELDALCTRLFALYRGQLAGPVAPGERARLGALMAGLAA